MLIVFFSLGRSAAWPEGVDANASASLAEDGGELVGTTEYVARLIREETGGELFSIRTAEPCPADFDAVVDQNHREAAEGFLPELEGPVLDVSRYDAVFVGCPVWAGGAPQAVLSFLAQHDLSGKTVIPFCTHDGYGAGSSFDDIEAAIPGQANVLDGLALEAQDVPGAADAVAQWLQELGIAPAAEKEQAGQTGITVLVGGVELEGVLCDTALAREIQAYFPLTVSMTGFGGREYYGGVEFCPQNLEGGRRTFENGHITCCRDHHNMAVFTPGRTTLSSRWM